MNEDHSIRPARLDEVERLGRIEAGASGLFAGTDVCADLNGLIYDPDELAQLIDQGQVWAASFEDDIPVGFVILLKMEDVLHDEELDVLPEFGRRGIGTALLKHACRWAIENGFSTAILSTFRDIPWNAPFYHKHGFRIFGPREFTPWIRTMR